MILNTTQSERDVNRACEAHFAKGLSDLDGGATKSYATKLADDVDIALAECDRLSRELDQQKADYTRLADGTEESDEWKEMRADRDAAITECDRLREQLNLIGSCTDKLRVQFSKEAAGYLKELQDRSEKLDTAIARAEKAARERDALAKRVKELEDQQGGFFHLDGLRESMVACADENDKLRAKATALSALVKEAADLMWDNDDDERHNRETREYWDKAEAAGVEVNRG